MNSCAKLIRQQINKFNQNEMIFSRELYLDKLSGIPELTFYKTLGRLVKSGDLTRLSKGIYSRPKNSRFGPVSINEEEMIRHYTGGFAGVVVGYRLFNKLGLTTQISGTTEIYSTILHEETKTIGNLSIRRINMGLDQEKIALIEVLEVLQNYQKIEDLNNVAFAAYLKNVMKSYSDKAAHQVLCNMKYKKSTIAFLRCALKYFGVENSLSRYLSSTSTYKIPEMEAIYEPAFA